MTKKWLLTFALAGLSVASAKTYTITVYEPLVVAGTQLKPGQYKLSLENSKAIFTNDRHKTVAEAKVTVQNSAKKIDTTAIESKLVGQQNQLEGIALGGTRMKLEFN
jgi:hypothetical protein